MSDKCAFVFCSSAPKIGNRDGDERIDAGCQIKGHTSRKYTQQGPHHCPAMQSAISFGCLWGFRQSCRSFGYWQTLSTPLWKTFGVTEHVIVAKLHSHPGCRVATDSCQAGSVKDNEPILIRTQEFFERALCPPSGPPSRFHGKVCSAFYVARSVFPLLPRIHQKQAFRVSFLTLP